MNSYPRSPTIPIDSSRQITASIVGVEPCSLLINDSMLFLMGLPTSVALFALVGTCPPPPVFSSLGLTPTKHRRLQCSSRDKEYDGDRQGDPKRASEQAANLRREITDLERDLASLKMSGKSMSISTSMGQDKTEALRQTASASRSSSAPSSPFKLAPTRWLIHMDIGREKGTWMPPTWGASGRRVEIDVSIQFLPGGEMAAEMASPFIDMTIKPGEWSVRPSAGSFRRRMNSEGNLDDVMSDTCQFWVECSGFRRGDVTIPPGKIFFAVPAWGGKLFRRGLVTIRQRRLFIREEARILGVFETEVLDVDADGRAQERAPRPRKPPFPSGY